MAILQSIAQYGPYTPLLAEAIGLVLFIVATQYVIRIGKTTGWFGAWYAAAGAMVLLVIRRALGVFELLVNDSPLLALLEYINSGLLLASSILFAYSFGSLYRKLKGADRPLH